MSRTITITLECTVEDKDFNNKEFQNDLTDMVSIKDLNEFLREEGQYGSLVFTRGYFNVH